jgi:glycosyltransferase involved in cell wall biosynthesis
MAVSAKRQKRALLLAGIVFGLFYATSDHRSSSAGGNLRSSSSSSSSSSRFGGNRRQNQNHRATTRAVGNFAHFFSQSNSHLSFREKQLTHLLGPENEWQPGFSFVEGSDEERSRFLNASHEGDGTYDGLLGYQQGRLRSKSGEYNPPHVTSDKTFGVKSIGIFHVFRKPPWGGGNQFLMALVKEFRRRKIKVVENAIVPGVKIYMANAVTFKVDPFREAFQKSGKKLKLVHRLDGPYYSARYNKDPRKEASLPYRAREDDRVYWINNEFACASIFQSKWSYDMNKMLGYDPKGYLQIVNNAVDDTIFHNRGRQPFSRLRKTKIMASSWSSGERKGFKTFKWLDDNLDFTKYEFFFSGNIPDGMVFKNIKTLPPVTSEKLAPMLREHDIFLAASYLEPCSNALVEALASGMPTVYQSGSGHAELVKAGGRSYRRPEQIPAMLDEVVLRFEEYQNNIRVTTVSEAADAYLQVYAACLSR